MTVIGKSAAMLPFTVSARSSASKTLGRVNVIPPFTVLKLAPLRPVGATHRHVHRAVDRVGDRAAGRREPDRPVDGVRFGVALQRLAVDFAVHRATDEADAVGDAHVEVHDGVVVACVRPAFPARFAAVRLAAGDVGIHGADGDASRVRDDLDADVGRVAPARGPVAVTPASPDEEAVARTSPLIPLISMVWPEVSWPFH